MMASSCLSAWRAFSPNVRLNVLYSALSSFAGSIVSGSVFLSPYIYFLDGNSNDDVGFVSAVSGIIMVILALPVGWLTDRYSKSSLLRAGGVAGLASSAVLFAALVFDSMPLLYAAAALNGVFSAVVGPPLNSLFADSVPSGKRTWIYSLQYALSLGAGAAGPLIGVFFFLFLGDEWRTFQLRAVMAAGNVIFALSCLMLWCFRDGASLGDESEGVLEAAGAGEGEGEGAGKEAPLLAPGSGGSSGDDEEQMADGAGGEGAAVEASPPPATSSSSSTQNLGHQTLRLLFCTLRVRHIPYIIFVSDFTIAVGAGMTVQFFALFFVNEYGLTPIQVSLTWVAAPLLIALLSTLAVPLARRIGRAWVAVLADAVGTACLFALSFKSPVWVAVPLYLLRTAAMNASYPLQRAILMDVVSKKDRGKWNSLENITSFTWTGSAALGGLLIDLHGYGFTLGITACIYVAATCVLATLIPLTWGERTDVVEEKEGEEGKEGEGEEGEVVVAA
jgi:MFS family permease